MSNLQVLFGKHLRRIRRNRDLSQEALAEQIGVSVNFISMLETGKAAPSFRTIERLCMVLKVDAEAFFKSIGTS